MADEIVETAEQKLARWAYVIDAQAKEIDRLRAELARMTEGASAYATLSDIHRNRDLPESVRVKAAIGCLPHEMPKIQSVPPPLDLVAEEIEPLAVVVARQRARCDALQREARDIEVSPSGAVRILPKLSSNGGNGSDEH